MSDLPYYWPAAEASRFPIPRSAFDTTLIRRAAAAAAHDPSALVAVSRTAAWLHGVDTLPPGVNPFGWPAEFCRHRQTVAARELEGIKIHRWFVPDDQTTIAQGIRATTADRTLIDCARMLPRLEAVAAADQLLNLGATLASARASAADQSRPPSHLRRIREVLELADSRSQSPMESWCRCMILDSELPGPRPQVPVSIYGGSTAYLDLGFEDYRVGVEYDGVEHHSSRRDVARDRHRRSLLARAGWSVAVFRADSVLTDPAPMLRQVLVALERRGFVPSMARRERILKRINYIAMQRRLERERWAQSAR